MLTHPVADDTTPTHRVPFTLPFHARWPDMDFNAHLRNAAYLGAVSYTHLTLPTNREV